MSYADEERSKEEEEEEKMMKKKSLKTAAPTTTKTTFTSTVGETKESAKVTELSLSKSKKKKKKNNRLQGNSDGNSQGNSKKNDKDTKQTTTRTLTVDAGSSFPPQEEETSIILDDVLKCLTISSLVQSSAISCNACARVVSCANVLCGGEVEEERKIDTMLTAARDGAQKLASSPETARVLRAVNEAISAVRSHEEMRSKVKELGGVSGSQGAEFNFFASEDQKKTTTEIAAEAVRRALA
jgi:hypothetical protein